MHSFAKYPITLCFLILKTTAQEIATPLYIYNNLPLELQYEICSYLDLKGYSFKDLSCAIEKKEKPYNIYFSQDNKRMAKVNKGKNIVEIIDLETNKTLYTINDNAINLDFNMHNLDQIALQHEDNIVFIYEKNSLITRVGNNNKNIPSLVKFVPDNKMLTFGTNKSLYLWDLNYTHIPIQSTSENFEINKVALNNNRTHFAIKESNNKIYIYRMVDNSKMTLDSYCRTENNRIISFIGYNNKNELISTTQNGIIINWDTNQEIKTKYVINNAAIHPTNPSLIALCVDVYKEDLGFRHPIILYDLNTKQAIAKIFYLNRALWQFSPDGQLLFSHSQESVITENLTSYYKLLEFCKARLSCRKLNTDKTEPETDKVALLQGTLLHVLLSRDRNRAIDCAITLNRLAEKTFKTLPESLQKLLYY